MELANNMYLGIFLYTFKEGKITILIVYVNDIILTGDDVYEIDHLKKELAMKLVMKNWVF